MSAAHAPFPVCPYVTGFAAITGEYHIRQEDFCPDASDASLLIYHESAALRYQIGDSILSADVGTVLFLPRNTKASAKPVREGAITVIGYYLEKGDESNAEPLLISTAAPRRLRDRFRHFFNSLHSADEGHELAMMADLYTILFELKRNSKSGFRRAMQNDKIRPSVAYIERHFQNPKLSISEIAALSGVSETYFRTLFKRQYGHTPIEHIKKLRIEEAKRIHTEDPRSIGEIETACEP